MITVIIKIHNKQENIVTDDDLSKTEIGSGVTDNAIKSKSAKSITDSNTNVEIESEKQTQIIKPMNRLNSLESIIMTTGQLQIFMILTETK